MLRLAATVVVLSLSTMTCAEPPPAATGPVLLIGYKGEDTVSFVDLATGQELGRSPTGLANHWRRVVAAFLAG